MTMARNKTAANTQRGPVMGRLKRISFAVFIKGKDLAHEKMGCVGLTRSFRMARLEERTVARDFSENSDDRTRG